MTVVVKVIEDYAPLTVGGAGVPIGVTSTGQIVGVAGAAQPLPAPINAPTKPGFYMARQGIDEWEPVHVLEREQSALGDWPPDQRSPFVVHVLGSSRDYELTDFAEYGAEIVFRPALGG
jgi:hypothetical protein